MMAPWENPLQVLPSSGGSDDRNHDANNADDDGAEGPDVA
jgi:hypothetical protein